jgi:hypothetical protein
MHSDLIADRLVTGVNNTALTKQLLKVPKLTLKECTDTCRSEQAAEKRVEALKTHSTLEINRVQPTYRSNARFVEGCKHLEEQTVRHGGKLASGAANQTIPLTAARVPETVIRINKLSQ